jgi:hypothetical protein
MKTSSEAALRIANALMPHLADHDIDAAISVCMSVVGVLLPMLARDLPEALMLAEEFSQELKSHIRHQMAN